MPYWFHVHTNRILYEGSLEQDILIGKRVAALFRPVEWWCRFLLLAAWYPVYLDKDADALPFLGSLYK